MPSSRTIEAPRAYSAKRSAASPPGAARRRGACGRARGRSRRAHRARRGRAARRRVHAVEPRAEGGPCLDLLSLPRGERAAQAVELGEEADVRHGDLRAQPVALARRPRVELVEGEREARPAGLGAAAPDVPRPQRLDHRTPQEHRNHPSEQGGYCGEVRLSHPRPVALIGPARGHQEAVERSVAELLPEPRLGPERGVRREQRAPAEGLQPSEDRRRVGDRLVAHQEHRHLPRRVEVLEGRGLLSVAPCVREPGGAQRAVGLQAEGRVALQPGEAGVGELTEGQRGSRGDGGVHGGLRS
jgi:hypothetical protein